MRGQFLGLVLTASLCLIGLADAAVAANDTTTETITSKATAICSSCLCDKNKKVLYCGDRHLSAHFKLTDWVALNATFTLSEVYFTFNRIANVTKYPDLPIRILDLSHNQIDHIADFAFANLTELTELDLSHNRLNSTTLKPSVLGGKYDTIVYEPMRKLKVLRLSRNNLHVLHPDVFVHLVELEELYLDENPFMVIESGTEIAISGIPKLRLLNLADCQLRTLPEQQFHAPRGLLHLDLRGNLLETIPDAFVFAINLETLILDENPIVRIGSGRTKFPAMFKLKRLSISNMQSLERIENHGLSNLEGLEQLNCTDNSRLSYIHSGALSRPGREEPSDTEWPDLKELYLHDNNLSVIDHNLLARWDNLEAIDISRNPWLCDCRTQWIIDTLLDKYGRSERNIKNVICEYPLELKGTKLVDLEKHNLDCVEVARRSDDQILVGVLIGILVGIPIVLMGFLIYKRGCFGLVKSGPADYSRAFYKRTAQDDMNF